MLKKSLEDDRAWHDQSGDCGTMNEMPHILIIDEEQGAHREFDLALVHHDIHRETTVGEETVPNGIFKVAMSKPQPGVEHALSGSAGIQKVRDSLLNGNPFQIAFIEIGMSSMDGIDLMERIWKIDAAIQMVLCVGPGASASDYDLERRLGRTGNALVVKRPFDSIQVIQIAATLGEKWSLARQAALKNEQMDALATQRSRRFIQHREYERLRDLDRKTVIGGPAGNGVSDLSTAQPDGSPCGKQADERFLRRTAEIVDAHMSDFDFDVGELARKMFMSRRQLLRKLKELAGCSPNAFIRSLRLKRAGQLLKTSEKTVSEVTYAVGFADLKYFRAVFHEEFGVTPAKYGRGAKTPLPPATDKAA
jgi:AraC-like DNA-binding protein/CheY-like chemotaxis protein